jgi:hypothetical protein
MFMSLPNRLVLPIILSTLAVLAGCGSGSHHAVPPPSGGYNNANFNGTYVFSTNGTDVNGAPIAMAGMVSADGNGHITGGTVDINDAEFDSPVLGLAVSGGSYSVSADGRGKASLSATTPFGSSIVVDFVLTSNSHGLITEFDGNASGSGTLDLQTTVTQAQLAGSYAFSFSGIDPAGNLPFGTIGSFTLDSNGTITSGVEDFDDTGFAYQAFTLNGNLVAQGTGAPYIATLTATNPSDVAVFGTMTFDVYPVDATHLKLVETDNFQDGSGLVSGDAFTQTGASIPTTATTYVFTMGGGVQNTGPITVGGTFPIDGAGNISGGFIDINLSGTTTQAPLNFGGDYGDSGSTVGGRTLFDLNNFQVAQQFIAYPTANAGLLMLEMDGGGTGFLMGSALPQSSSTLAASQGYGMNLAGVNSVEEDDIAEFTTTSTGFSGLVDYNDQGSTAFNQTLTGTYAADGPPDGRYDFLSNGFNGELYVVDASTALFVELDSTQVGVGTIQLQAATTSSAKTSRVLVPNRTVLPRSAKERNAAQWRHPGHRLHK